MLCIQCKNQTFLPPHLNNSVCIFQATGVGLPPPLPGSYSLGGEGCMLKSGEEQRIDDIPSGSPSSKVECRMRKEQPRRMHGSSPYMTLCPFEASFVSCSTVEVNSCTKFLAKMIGFCSSASEASRIQRFSGPKPDPSGPGVRLRFQALCSSGDLWTR